MDKIISVIINFIGIISALMAIKDWIAPQIRQGNMALGSIMIIFIWCILILVLFRKKISFFNYMYRLISFKITKINRSYILESRETIYEYFDRYSMKHSKNFDILVLSDSFNVFEDKFIWDYTDYNVSSKYPDQIVTILDKDHGYNIYQMRFAKKILKNEKVSAGIVLGNLLDI